MASGVYKETERMLVIADHINEMSTLSSSADSGHGWSERSTAHYETLPGTYNLIYMKILNKFMIFLINYFQQNFILQNKFY